jgi:hypothetical protein
MAKKAIEVGDTVRLTGEFLRNTGQQAGEEGRKRWKVLALEGPDHFKQAVVDEDRLNPEDMFTAEEMEKQPNLRKRWINTGNLEKVRKR